MKITERQIRSTVRQILREQDEPVSPPVTEPAKPRRHKTIELGTPPENMGARPRLMQSVLKGTGLPGDGDPKEVDRRSLGASFGDEEWDYSDVDDDLWDSVNDTLKKRISSMYNGGQIRYGSW